MEHLSSDMEQQNQQVQWQRESARSLQQRIQPKRYHKAKPLHQLQL
jgi:hypothetical protein